MAPVKEVVRAAECKHSILSLSDHQTDDHTFWLEGNVDLGLVQKWIQWPESETGRHGARSDLVAA